MDIAGLVVSVLAVITAGASVLYARGANRRADEANRTAESALDLQARADAREREFREVRWSGRFELDSERRAVFRLSNEGHTDAHAVSLLIAAPGEPERLHQLGDISAGDSADALISNEPMTAGAVQLMIFTDDPWRVHWSSPLGHAEEYRYAGNQLR